METRPRSGRTSVQRKWRSHIWQTAGRVSTAKKTFGLATDDPWKVFPAKLIQVSDAPVVPVHFQGQNGWLFQFVSKFSGTLREALILREVAKQIGGRIDARIGDVISPEVLKYYEDRHDLLDFVRERAYDLADEG